jgi:hypothetical protein
VNPDDFNPFEADGGDPTDLATSPKAKGVYVGPRYFRVPGQLFGSGLAQTLGPSATLLYVALWENGNRQNPPSNTFGTTDKKLSSETRLSPRTIRDARNRLIEKYLISCTREPGAKFEYTLLPQSLKWTPTEQRLRVKKRPRANHSKVRQNLADV